ncbi:hypothetical protein ACQ4M4_22610 [Leptolyngbya sp. AN02str]|uniref:hypothetical protein n=1 Tax=Leptolyngbya sp. AN02str TaxID=3423363 RepID=UPI003D31842F
MAALKDQWHALGQQRQSDLVERQQAVQALLSSFRQERCAIAQQVRTDLHQFRSALHAETANQLSVIAAERSLMSQQLFQELGEFRQSLSRSVSELRGQLQHQVEAMRVQMQDLLQDHGCDRTVMRQQLMHDLTTYVRDLQADVQTYLVQLEQERSDRAQHVATLLQHSRTQRLADVDALMQEFADFRQTLRQFHQTLQQSVWGLVEEEMPAALDQLAAQLSGELQMSIPKALAVVASKPEGESAPEGEFAPLSKPMQRDTHKLEEDIFTLVHNKQGARLTEIESNLGINRFQAVDALRSLIKKGMIIQRDRTYLIPEELSL